MCYLLVYDVCQSEGGPGCAAEEYSVTARKWRQDGCPADEARREGEKETSRCDPLFLLF